MDEPRSPDSHASIHSALQVDQEQQTLLSKLSRFSGSQLLGQDPKSQQLPLYPSPPMENYSIWVIEQCPVGLDLDHYTVGGQFPFSLAIQH